MTRPQNDRLAGMFVGLATGDALGMPLEFEKPGQFTPVTGMVAGGPFDLPVGYWTDDTSMALCLADSLISQSGYDSFDVMDRYTQWYKDGYRSSTGACFDIGVQTRGQIQIYETQKLVVSETKRSKAAGNGSLMRLAPIVIASIASGLGIQETAKLSKLSARETHFSHEAESATKMFGAMLWRAAHADDKKHVADVPPPTSSFERKLLRTILHSAGVEAQDLKPTGYVVDTLEAASWAFFNSESFGEGALKAVNLGGDSDTIGAVYGQLAGAVYGLEAIPQAWRSQLAQIDELLEVAGELVAVTDMKVIQTRFAEDTLAVQTSFMDRR